MNLDMHPEARLEFREAIIYYEDCREGLGLEFSREIYESINRVADAPLLWSSRSEPCVPRQEGPRRLPSASAPSRVRR